MGLDMSLHTRDGWVGQHWSKSAYPLHHWFVSYAESRGIPKTKHRDGTEDYDGVVIPVFKSGLIDLCVKCEKVKQGGLSVMKQEFPTYCEESDSKWLFTYASVVESADIFRELLEQVNWNEECMYYTFSH